MRTKDVYLKAINTTRLPMARLGYVFEDANSVIQIGRDLCVELSKDKEIMNRNLESMKIIEENKGFMFWNLSDEGQKFFTENKKVFSKVLTNMVLNQK